MIRAARLCNDVRNTHARQRERCEDRGVDPLTDAEDHDVAVLYAGLEKRLFIEVFYDKRIFRVLAYLAYAVLVRVENEDLLSALGELKRERFSKTAEAYDAVHLILILCCVFTKFHDTLQSAAVSCQAGPPRRR